MMNKKLNIVEVIDVLNVLLKSQKIDISDVIVFDSQKILNEIRLDVMDECKRINTYTSELSNWNAITDEEKIDYLIKIRMELMNFSSDINELVDFMASILPRYFK